VVKTRVSRFFHDSRQLPVGRGAAEVVLQILPRLDGLSPDGLSRGVRSGRLQPVRQPGYEILQTRLTAGWPGSRDLTPLRQVVSRQSERIPDCRSHRRQLSTYELKVKHTVDYGIASCVSSGASVTAACPQVPSVSPAEVVSKRNLGLRVG
jgi:hypothetical protein